MATPKIENVVRDVLRNKLDPDGTIEPSVVRTVDEKPWIKPLALVSVLVIAVVTLITLVRLVVGVLTWTLPLIAIGIAVWAYQRRDVAPPQE